MADNTTVNPPTETDGSQKGSQSNAVTNTIYTDLTLTAFPNYLDVRTGTVGVKNINMYRQTNLKHYNMAEHVNALQDAVMSIQRALGAKVQEPLVLKNADGTVADTDAEILAIQQASTVKKRLDIIEGTDWQSQFDKRYGGPSWVFTGGATTNPTIQQHKHTGATNGMPSKISLTAEVTGLLPKANVNLTSTGVTGSDLLLNATVTKTIDQAIEDAVSEETGGTIAQGATLTVLGKTNTRWTREFDYLDRPAGTNFTPDTNTLLGQVAEGDLRNQTDLLNASLSGMHYGRYVTIIRLSSNNSTSASDLVEIVAVDPTTGAAKSTPVVLKGTDFLSSSNYKSFYHIFENDGNVNLRIRKLSTIGDTKIRLDYAIVEPVHPAVFDR